MSKRPVPEIEVSEELVCSLLRAERPDLAALPVRELARGWDNTNYRLGEDLLVRVPHRKVAAPLIAAEQQWLPALAERIDLAIPAPVHAGSATSDFPWPWSIVPFMQGAEAAGATLTNEVETARRLGTFFSQLHVDAPADAPVNLYRGCALNDRAASFATNVDRLPAAQREPLTSLFHAGATAEPATDSVWLHGDLHLRNIIIDTGELTAIIDWGDISSGDRATDLAGAYMLVPGQLQIVQSHAAASESDWQRARGWAANFAAIYLAHSDDDPVMLRIGSELFETLLLHG